MGYVEDTLGQDETIDYKARFHWLYTLTAWLNLLILGLVVVGIFIFFAMMIKKWTTEIVVTSRRFVYKTGWISRATEEIPLRRLEEVNLDQSIMGRLFDYGKLTVSGVGVGKIELPNIDSPLAFRKAIADSRAKAEHSGQSSD
jgi:uncharacterized membrane protein YdbT with pleckstrin-like domain|tara:strand:+ start:128 stop:556 length:429 start_codon:yes stop_codon:yes gene_type:complete